MIADGKAYSGDVLLNRQHEFDDGGTAPQKLVVVYGSLNGNVLLLVCTSKEKFGRRQVPSCHHEHGAFDSNFFLLPPAKKKGKFKSKQKPGFKAPTWIILDPYYMPEKELAARMDVGRAHRLFSLVDSDYQALRSCFRKAPEFAPFMDEFQEARPD